MKKLLIIAISLIAGISCAFGIEANGLEVALSSGETATVLFDARPELSFVGSRLVITLPDREGLSYELDDVESIVFKTVAGIDDICANTITMEADSQGITFGHLAEGSQVAIYDLQGRTVQSTTATERYTIARGTLPRGVYIVKINNFTTKLSF